MMTERACAAWFLERDRFLVLTHVRPDGDTLGSATALCLALQKLGKTAYTLPNPGLTETYSGYLDFQWAPADYTPDYVVAVDIATEGLFPPGEQRRYLGRVDLCIDHHPSNTGYAKALCLDASAAACGEVVYRLCQLWGVMAEPIARALYIALSTDCGCFVFSNTTAQTHRIAADLLEQTDVAPINKHFFQTKSPQRLQLEGILMTSEQFYERGAVCIGSVTLADKTRVGADEGDCEELASYAATIQGVRCAATLRELSPDQWKLSLRTDPAYVDANQVCALLGGGGHPAASGATIPDMTEAEARETVHRCILQRLAEKG